MKSRVLVIRFDYICFRSLNLVPARILVSLFARFPNGRSAVQTKRKFIGQSPARREDVALLRGQGRFADDVRLSDPLFVAFARSLAPCGQIVACDLDDARQAEGVVAVHDGQDVGTLGNLSVNPVLPIHHLPDFPVLAQGHVGAVGQPIAAVLATSQARATDACELIYAEVEDAVQEPRVIASKRYDAGDFEAALADAAHVVSCQIQHPRLAPSPMEPRSIAVAYDAATEGVTVWHSTQTPHRTRSELSSILGVDADRIRVIAQFVGGAFGLKASLYPEEVFAVWAAFQHRRNVKWTATRSEEFLSGTHGRGLRSSGTLALDAEGNLLGLKAKIEAPVGAWLPNSGLIPAWNAARVLPSGYKVGALDVQTTALQTFEAPTGIYRGAGRPEANCLMERLLDKAARVMDLDPVELRKRNLLQPNALPHQTQTGNVLDSGDYAQALDMLCAHGAYQKAVAERDARRAAGELVGLGVAFYMEPSGSGWESAEVTLTAGGSVLVDSGSSSQGHGRETAFAQIAAEVLEVDPADVQVQFSDTAKTPEGIGALASRSTAIGGSAVLEAARDVAKRRSAGEALPIRSSSRYENEGQAWGYGAYLVQLSVNRDTGAPHIEKITCVDDAGVLVNPKQVEGQILGGIAQGLGEALMENVVYDEGQLLTGSFMDYAMPRATDMPQIDIFKTETPSPTNLLGAKGVGEAGTIGAPIAVLNAAIDAVSPLGITDLEMPLTSQVLWQAIRTAEQGKK